MMTNSTDPLTPTAELQRFALDLALADRYFQLAGQAALAGDLLTREELCTKGEMIYVRIEHEILANRAAAAVDQQRARRRANQR